MADLRDNLKALIEFDPGRRVVKLLHDSPKLRVVLFCLLDGQEVPPHTAPSEVVFYVFQGRGEITVGGERQAVGAGDILTCPPEAPHGLRGEDNFVVLAVIAPPPP